MLVVLTFVIAIVLRCLTSVAQVSNEFTDLQAIEAAQERLYRDRTAISNSPDAPKAWKQARDLDKQITRRESQAKKDLEPLER
jgi:hypothetical protein